MGVGLDEPPLHAAAAMSEDANATPSRLNLSTMCLVQTYPVKIFTF